MPAAARESAFTTAGKAPLYWMGYEECFVSDVALSQDRWSRNVDWVAENLKDYGYTMVCTDGWIEGAQTTDRNGYITKYSSDWSMTLEDMVTYASARGLECGIYYDPLWLTSAAWMKNFKIEGRDDVHTKDIVGDTQFNGALYWVDTNKDGAEEWVKGYVRHFKEIGFKFLRIDFLNYYENAYGTSCYLKALNWICEEAGDDMWVSLVMPNCYGHANNEKSRGDMFRISEDVFGGGFDFVSQRRRGSYQNGWANWGNLFDGFVDYSDLDRHTIIMDGDFVRLNTVARPEEKEFWLSLLVMAGSPISVADQYDTIGDDLHYYQNTELLDLVKEGFHGKPLSRDLNDHAQSSVWWGMTSNGDCVVALFNREETAEQRTFPLSLTGKSGAKAIRNLWTGSSLSERSGNLTRTVAPHSVEIFRFTPSDDVEPLPTIGMLGLVDNIGCDAPNAYLMDYDDATRTFVWEGLLMEHGNIWNNRQFNFTSGRGEWNQVDFYIPEKATDDNYREPLNEGTFKMRKVRGEGQPLSASWSINTSDNGRYRIYMDPTALTLRVERVPHTVYALGALAGEWDSQYAVPLEALDGDKAVYHANIQGANPELKDIKFCLNRNIWQETYYLIPAEHGTKLIVGQPMPLLVRSNRWTKGYENTDDHSAGEPWASLDQQDNFYAIPDNCFDEWDLVVDSRAMTVTMTRPGSSVEEISLGDAGNFNASYNRATGKLYVSADTTLGEVRIFDPAGATIFAATSNASEAIYDLDNLRSGIYIVSTAAGHAKIFVNK